MTFQEVNNMVEYLPLLANYRNVCAHEDLCFNNRTHKKINPTKYHDILNIPKNTFNEYIYGINDMFSVVIIMKEMLKDDDFSLMMNEISYELDILEGKLTSINIDKVLDVMGFPVNYKDIVRLK